MQQLRGKVDGNPPKREGSGVAPIAGARDDDGADKKAMLRGKERIESNKESGWRK
jgi:hypothetical protein